MADDKDLDLLSRADSLIRPDAAAAIAERRENPRQMRRRRSFLASATPSDAARFARRSGEDDDLPVLTEVVLAEPAEPEETVESIAARLRPGLAADLAALLDRHLAAELPALLETAARNASEHLRQALQTTIASALRDFVGERGQLQLPLESADASEAVAADQDPD